MKARPVALVVPPAPRGMSTNREGASGLGSLEPGGGGFRYPPQTTAQCGACLRQAGIEPLVIDAPAMGRGVDEALAGLQEAGSAIVAVQVSWATAQADGAFCQAVRERLPNASVVTFGAATRWIAPDTLGADVLLEGEPDLALADICRRLLAGEALPPVVRTRDLRGHDAQGLVRNLDDLPRPAWDLLPTERYPFLTILSSRGCDHGCDWCPYSVAQGTRFRARSAESVVGDLAWLAKAFAPSRIVLRDPVFARDRERVTGICHGILQHRDLHPGRNLFWECETRPDHLDAPLVRLMALAGCTAIKAGLETTDADVLVAHGRVADSQAAAGYLQRTASLARECANLGVAYRLYAMVGLPDQTEESVRETAGFIAALRPHTLTTKPFRVYPGIACEGPPAPKDQVALQMAVMEQARRSMADLPQRSPSRWSRALARRIYRLQARLSRRT